MDSLKVAGPEAGLKGDLGAVLAQFDEGGQATLDELLEANLGTKESPTRHLQEAICSSKKRKLTSRKIEIFSLGHVRKFMASAWRSLYINYL